MASYYIDPDLGSNLNSGTSEAAPIAGYDKAGFLSGLAAGDVVRQKCGTRYVGEVDVASSGAYSSPITFGAYGNGAQPIIDGASNFSAFDTKGFDHITLSGLRMINGTGANLLLTTGSTGIRIQECSFGGASASANISASGCSDITVSQCVMETSGQDNVYMSSCSRVSILRNIMRAPDALGGNLGDNIQFDGTGCDDIVVEGNNLEAPARKQNIILHGAGSRGSVSYNTCKGSTNCINVRHNRIIIACNHVDGLGAASYGISVESPAVGCSVRGNVIAGATSIAVRIRDSNVAVIGNKIKGDCTYGIDVGPSCDNTLISGNSIFGNAMTHGIHSNNGLNAFIYKNTVANTLNAALRYFGAAAATVTARNNVFYSLVRGSLGIVSVGSAKTYTSSNNLFAEEYTNFVEAGAAGAKSTLAALQAAGKETSSVVGDPLLDALLRTASGSPCRGTGAQVGDSILYDADGKEVTGAVDIGSHQARGNRSTGYRLATSSVRSQSRRVSASNR